MFAFLLRLSEFVCIRSGSQEHSPCLGKQKALGEAAAGFYLGLGAGSGPTVSTVSSGSDSLPHPHTSKTPCCGEICPYKKQNRRDLINAGRGPVPTETRFCQHKPHCHRRGRLVSVSNPPLVSAVPEGQAAREVPRR